MKTFVQYINDAQVLYDPSTDLSYFSISGSHANRGPDRIWPGDLVLINGQPVTIVREWRTTTDVRLFFKPGLPESPRSLRRTSYW
jgi:hypothetical protein